MEARRTTFKALVTEYDEHSDECADFCKALANMGHRINPADSSAEHQACIRDAERDTRPSTRALLNAYKESYAKRKALLDMVLEIPA